MVLKIFSVYDSKAEFHNTPFFMQSRGEAIRGFKEMADDGQTAIGRHPADFTLFELGEYDNLKATFSLHPTPVSLGLALELRTPAAAAAGPQQSLPLRKAGA